MTYEITYTGTSKKEIIYIEGRNKVAAEAAFHDLHPDYNIIDIYSPEDEDWGEGVEYFED